MANKPLSFKDYVKEAFFRKVPVPGMGGLPINLMGLGAFAVLGLANPGFWLLGLAAELGYLGYVAGSDRFQNVVKGERLLEDQRSWEDQIGAAVARLRPGLRERYQRLLVQGRRVLGISETLTGSSLGSFRDLQARDLNQLLAIFLRLLASRQTIEDNIQGLDQIRLRGEIEQLEERLKAAGQNEALTRSIQGTLDIQRRRLENLDRAIENLRVIDAELLRIEQQVELLREESAISGSPGLLSERLDSVTSSMGETTRWIDEHAEVLGSLGEAESSGPPIPDLPQLPTAVEES